MRQFFTRCNARLERAYIQHGSVLLPDPRPGSGTEPFSFDNRMSPTERRRSVCVSSCAGYAAQKGETFINRWSWKGRT